MKRAITANPIAWYYVMISLRSCDFLGAVLIPFFTDWGHISQGSIQFLESWFFLWATILDIPTGIIADRIPRKYAMAFGIFCSALGFLLYGSVSSFPVFMVAEVIIAIGIAFISGAEEAWLSGTLTDLGRRQEASIVSGRAVSVSSFSRMLTAPLGTIIALSWGLNAPILCYAIPASFAGIIMLLMPEPQKNGSAHKMTMTATARVGFSFIWKSRELRSITINAALVGVAGYFVIWLYQPLLRQASVPIVYFGLMHTVLSGAQLLIAGSFHIFARVFRSDQRFIRFMALATTLAFIVPVLYPHLSTALFFVIIGGGFGLTRRQAMFRHINDHIPTEEENRKATIMSIISFVQRLMIALCNPLVGVLATYSLRITLGLLAILPFWAWIFSPHSKNEDAS